MNPLGSEPSGVLLLAKPRGPTSRDVVDRVQEEYPSLKMGHGGTLDPAAEGLLPILVEEATKLVPYLHRLPKTYRVQGRLDQTSDTLDTEGRVREVPVPSEPAEQAVQDALDTFRGEIEQVPPRYSAVRKDGKRLYEWSREGKSVEPERRTVTCYSLELLTYDFPHLSLTLKVGKGFYVRSLIRDLGRELGLDGGVVTALSRTQYGPYTLEQAVPVREVQRWEQAFFPPRSVVQDYYQLIFTGEALQGLVNGAWVDRNTAEPEWAAALDDRGRLRALLQATEKRGRPQWRPRRVLNRS